MLSLPAHAHVDARPARSRVAHVNLHTVLVCPRRPLRCARRPTGVTAATALRARAVVTTLTALKAKKT